MTLDPHPPPTPSALHQTALCSPLGGSEEAELPPLPVCVSVSLCVENQTFLLTCVYVCVYVDVCAPVLVLIPPSFLIMKWNYSSIMSCSAIGWR